MQTYNYLKDSKIISDFEIQKLKKKMSSNTRS